MSRAESPRTASPFIASRSYDALFFIFSPLLALGIAESLPIFDYVFERTHALGHPDTRVGLFIAVFTGSHLVAVFFRSHGNREIFARHRFRFTWVPAALYLSLALAPTWLFVTAVLVGFFWDVYHSSMQNFGLCRIYDSKLGNEAEAGRRLDYWINHVLYIGPIFIGASLMTHADRLSQYETVGWTEPSRWALAIASVQDEIRLAVIAAAGAFLVFYAVCYWRLCRKGYRLSPNKLLLLASVGVSCVWAWGFLPPVEAFFVVNLFHAAQYFALVWWTERGSMIELLHLGRLRAARLLSLLIFVAVLAAAGAATEAAVYSKLQWLGAAAITCALLHFWYDGFIWSVRRSEV